LATLAAIMSECGRGKEINPNCYLYPDACLCYVTLYDIKGQRSANISGLAYGCAAVPGSISFGSGCKTALLTSRAIVAALHARQGYDM
jgi:hypothetical protein